MEFTVDRFSSELRLRETDALHVFEVGFEGGTRMPLHHHPYPCLSLIMTGGFTEAIGPRELVARPGSLLSKPAGVRHTDVWGRYGSRQVVLVPSIREDDGEPLWGPLVREPRVRMGEGWLIAARRIAREIRLSDDLTALGVEIAVHEALDRERPRTAASPAASSIVSRARDFIHAHFNRSLTTRRIADDVGVSRAHLARTFRAVGGRTLSETIRRLRVEHAACLRLTTDRPLSQIAQESGFADQSHMTREFGRILGTTPGRFPEAG